MWPQIPDVMYQSNTRVPIPMGRKDNMRKSGLSMTSLISLKHNYNKKGHINEITLQTISTVSYHPFLALELANVP